MLYSKIEYFDEKLGSEALQTLKIKKYLLTKNAC